MEKEPVLGEELQTKRQALGLSREDVFRKLRVSLEFIENIETGQLKQCPANTYTVGFIRSYCDFLDVNPQIYIAELMLEHQAPKGLLKQTKETLASEPSEQPLWLREVVMWAGVIGIILLGWVTYTVVFEPNAQSEDQQVSADSIDIRAPKFPMR